MGGKQSSVSQHRKTRVYFTFQYLSSVYRAFVLLSGICGIASVYQSEEQKSQAFHVHIRPCETT